MRHHALRGGDARRRVQLGGMALPIAHAQRMHREALLLRKRDNGGGIHAPGQQNNGFFHDGSGSRQQKRKG